MSDSSAQAGGGASATAQQPTQPQPPQQQPTATSATTTGVATAPASSSSSSSTKQPPTRSPSLDRTVCRPKTWNIVASWSHDTQQEVCTICRVSLQECCVVCQGQVGGQIRCVIAFGSCGHSYHNHCLVPWTRNNNVCPVCRQPWETERYSEAVEE